MNQTALSGNGITNPCRLILLLAIAVFCSTGLLFAETIYVVNSQSRTLSRINTDTDAVQNVFAQLGYIPNKVIVDDQYLWCINSGDNAVQKLNRETGAVLSNILVANGSNPWDGCLDGGYLYVSGLFTNKVYRINTQTGLAAGNVNVGTSPEALAVAGGKLYVCNAGNYSQNYVGSSVSVIDIASFSVVKTIPVAANPQYLSLHNGMVHVSSTGNWADVAGCISVIDPATDTVVQTINLGGTPGRIWINSQNKAYVADSNGSNLYSYNAVDYNIFNGSANPITDGGSEVCGTNNLIAVLAPNWGSNGTVKIFHPDLSAWKQYSVGMVPTDMKIAFNSSYVSDEVVHAPIAVTAYPNPVPKGAKLHFDLEKSMQAELRLYNLKGQLVSRQKLSGKGISIPTETLDSGCYFYKISSITAVNEKQTATGKIVVIK
jgi:YVTN family beta-propeller protein